MGVEKDMVRLRGTKERCVAVDEEDGRDAAAHDMERRIWGEEGREATENKGPFREPMGYNTARPRRCT